MKTGTENCCSICFEILSLSENTKITEETMEYLKLLILKINTKLFDSPICEACSTKIQSACKFKRLYLENLPKTVTNRNKGETIADVKMEETEVQNCIKCEICKNIINPSDCISLFHSFTELNKLDLYRYLSAELELKIQENPQTCEVCHKYLLNFCNIISSLSIFDQDKIGTDGMASDNKNIRNEHFRVDININSGYSNENFKIGIKEEAKYLSESIKEEKDDSENGEYNCKNEETDEKIDYSEDTEAEQMWLHRENIAETDTETIGLINMTKNPNQVKTIECPICQFKPKHKQYLKKHMLLHNSNVEITNFECEICGFQTKNRVCLQKHMLTHKMSKEVEMYTCYNCKYQTKHREDLREHMLVHKKLETFQCQLCEYQSKRKCELTRHMLTHKNVNEMEMCSIEMFHCQLCDFKTKHRYHLNNHMLIHKEDNEVVMFQCDICRFKTKRKSSLKKHALIHKKFDETELFTCDLCKYQTKRKDTLMKHKLIHEDVRYVETFQCQVCDCLIKRKGDMIRHMLTHKNSDEIKMYPCQLCKYKSKRKSDVTKHMLIHKRDNKANNEK